MKIRKLIEDLLKDNLLDDEIIVSYWDKNYFVETNEFTLEDVDKVWEEFVKEGQETVDGHLDFTQTGYDLGSDLEELIKGNDGE
jgi:maltose-binding protein MalE